jgi:hypothetical protein
MTTMKMTKTTRRRLMAIAALALLGAAGCELAVDFDRTKIDAGGIDASFIEGGGDTTIPVDANDAAIEAGTDTGPDTQPIDGGPDADADDGAAADADDGAADADAE